MARQSFRGAGGAGAVVLPYHRGAAGEQEMAWSANAVPADGDRRLTGALAILASGVLVVVGILLAGWTFVA